MKINFLVPTTGLTGGIKVIFEHANNLAKWGHEVRIIYPYILPKNPSLMDIFIGRIKQLRRLALKLTGRDTINWFNLDVRVKIVRVKDLSPKNIPPADATIATANETADWLADYPENRGEKYYFIQDYEIWTRAKGRVDATWKMPFKKIVIADWLKRLAEEKFNEKVSGIVPNAVDIKKFYNLKKAINKGKKILIMYHVLEKKGFTDGLAAYEMAKIKHPEISLTLFGAYKPGSEIRKRFSFYFHPSQEKLRELYSAHDIFLWPSWFEGFSLPPLEAMACQCAVIATDTGAIRECAVAGQTAMIVPPHRPDLMAEKMIELIEDDNLLEKISLAGYNKIKDFSWEKSTKILESILTGVKL
jgi:glycosyltransferase involved in cell wall biosynthesis